MIGPDTLFAPSVLSQISSKTGDDGPATWPLADNFNIADMCCDRWAKAQPDRLALIEAKDNQEARYWSYAELFRAANQLAHYLREQNIAEGDRVAVLLPQGPEVLIAHFAAYRIGAILLPLFTLFGPDALQYRLFDSGAKLVITDTDSLEKIAPISTSLPNLSQVLVCGQPEDQPKTMGTVTLRSFWDEISQMPMAGIAAETGADDPAMLIYTSGTTGHPKGALHAHRFLMGHLPNIEISHQFIANHQIKNMFLPPTALKLMRQYERTADHLPAMAVRSIASGGEALGASLLDWARRVLKVEINEIYGQTECNLVICTSRPTGLPVPDGAMGRAVPGHQVCILGPDGCPADPGIIGEIAVKAPDPVMFLRYWNKPQETAEKMKQGWLLTGDLGCQDEKGFFTFISRDDDVITSSGYRIGPAEIENCLMQHASVSLAAVIGLPDDVRTEAVTACIVPATGTGTDTLADTLKQHVRERLSAHLVPRRIIWMDHLPLTATGKIRRKDLKESLLPEPDISLD